MLITGTLPASITLRAIAPFLLEGTCLLTIFIATVLLAFPLASHINTLFGKHKKFKGDKLAEAPSATNYPSLPPLPTVTPSLSILQPGYPWPVTRSREELIANTETSCIPISSGDGDEENCLSKFTRISKESGLVSYNSYRHKLIEETLQKQYGGGYAPGDVILNLIQLNTADSSSSIILAKKYDRSFFDHIQSAPEGFGSSLCDGISNSSELLHQDIGYPNPLAHFIPRNLRKPSTTETQTETGNSSEISIGVKPSPVQSARPNTPSYSCQRINSRRSREANYPAKSPFVTPVHSQSPIKPRASLSQKSRDNHRPDSNAASGRGEAVNLVHNLALIRDQAPLTEQLFRRNDTRPDVVSRTHVEAEEYLNRIVKKKKKKKDEMKTSQMVQEPRIKSSLKKSRQQAKGGKQIGPDNEEKVLKERSGDSQKSRKSKRDDFGRLSTLKPTVWNN